MSLVVRDATDSIMLAMIRNYIFYPTTYLPLHAAEEASGKKRTRPRPSIPRLEKEAPPPNVHTLLP